ncbi:1,5-anhydro-D-fructose reductase [bacterium HR17]|jgi:predicted dehydrogenase|uniref:1,5-anhydro-D-fructose reductase n=1 Tax=Candidatus Fervidibacter japonicus TaxID=2035412 RepID=A0A2H5XF90_9BACT|nr:1,5-anhydro-D-fructose reductase [bacterium HR17]
MRDLRDLLALDYSIPLPPRTDYGIGVIGCGGIMNNAHLPAYQKFGFRVVACCDIREDAAKATAERFSIPRWFTDYRRLLELPEVDIVDIAIHQQGRVEIVQAAAQAGKHILIQKPFAHTLDDAQAMVDACERAGVKLMVNQQARYAPGHRFAKLLIAQGWLGEVFHLTHHVRGNQDSGWFAQTPNALVVDHGIHYLDLMRYWSGREPQRVYATTVRMPGQRAVAPMVYSINLEFDEHLMANLWFNDVVQGKDSHYEFTIDGTQGTVRGNATQVTVALQGADIPVLRLELKGSWFPDAFAATMAELMRAIQQNDEPAVAGRDNLKTLRLALAAVRSSEEHCPVSL